MKYITVAIVLAAMVPLQASAAKTCDEIKDNLARKMSAADAKRYELKVMPAAEKAEGKTLAKCEAGSKKVVRAASGRVDQNPAKYKPNANSYTNPNVDHVVVECKEGEKAGNCKKK